MTDTEDLLTVNEVAALLRVHRETVLRHIRKGLIRAVKIGRTLRIPREALNDTFYVNKGDQ